MSSINQLNKFMCSGYTQIHVFGLYNLIIWKTITELGFLELDYRIQSFGNKPKMFR